MQSVRNYESAKHIFHGNRLSLMPIKKKTTRRRYRLQILSTYRNSPPQTIKRPARSSGQASVITAQPGLGVPPFDDVISLIDAEHRVVRRIQTQQPREMRVHAQPLRGEDAQDVRMSHQQHIMAVFQQRRNLIDGALGAYRCFFQRLARPGMDRHLLAQGKVSTQRPPAWASASAARHATHPIQNRWPHSPAGAYAPRLGHNPIQRCRPTHRGPQNRPVQRVGTPASADWKTHSPD